MTTKRRTIEEQIGLWMARAVEVGECLEWGGAFSCNGVTPVVKVKLPGKTYSDNVAVNRVLWEAANGPIPEGMLVYRKCCNNACVCLAHLAMGTRAQWLAHRKKLGLTKHKQLTKLKITVGARARQTTKNTLEKAREVRSLKGQMTQREIARVTGVSEGMVSDICDGVAWREVVASPFAGLMV